MNTKETTGESQKEYSGDKLDQIFSAQGDLMSNYKEIAEKHYSKIFKSDVKFSEESFKGGAHNIHTKEGNYLIRDMLNAASQEIGEAIQVLKNWKAWKQTEMASDEEHFKEELIDALHFYIEACIFAGITSEELHEIYFKKNEVNHFRQESNY